jgi:hypothetical protein
MRQSISGVTTGDKYYVTAQLSQPSFSSGFCNFVINADEQVLVQLGFTDTDVVFCGRFDASGVFESAAPEFILTYYCYNDAGRPIEVWDSSSTRHPRPHQHPRCRLQRHPP